MTRIRPQRGTLLLMALMLLSLALLAVLTWQTVRTASSQLAAAERVLRDYAALAAAEYARRLQVGVGYSLLHRLGQQLVADGADPAARARAALERMGPPARGIDPAAAVAALWTWAGEGAAPESLLEESDGRPVPPEALAATALAELGRDQPFVVSHVDRRDAVDSYVIYSRPSGGFLLARLNGPALAPGYAWVWSNEALLPEVLARRVDGNQAIHLRFRDPGGRVLFESPGRDDPYLRHTLAVDDDYGGIYRGYTIEASVDPAFADSLIIGGLPRSRLPLLLLLIAVTLAVIGATFYLVFRERALARLRSDFVARVSHELRTPLTQIRMFAETLLLGRVDEEGRQREYLGIINREAQRLGHLVDNVLAFSRREKAGRSLRIGAVNLESCATEVAQSYAPLASAKGDRILTRVDPSLVALADREALAQVLLNLLDNACKYGPEGQTVELSGWSDDGDVFVSVQDAGPGIPEGRKQAIWEPYRRLAREQRRALNGTGIGLSVARELIEAMAGSYRVLDVDGGGASFVVRLPSADPTGAPPEAPR